MRNRGQVTLVTLVAIRDLAALRAAESRRTSERSSSFAYGRLQPAAQEAAKRQP
jgi:hypothetical protein